MHPWMLEQMASQHGHDLRDHAGTRPLPATAAAPPPTTWDARLGWLLIRIGTRLVTARATPTG
jgi:Mg/Co/Ni transporter MgtE